MCEIDTQLLLKEYGIAFDNYSYRDRLIVQEFYLAIWLFSGLIVLISYFVYDKPPIEIPLYVKGAIIGLIAIIGFFALHILQISIDKLMVIREISMKRIEEIEKCLSKESVTTIKKIKECLSNESEKRIEEIKECFSKKSVTTIKKIKECLLCKSEEKCCCSMQIGRIITAIGGPSVSNHIKRFIQFMIVLWVGICIIMFTQIF